MCPGRDRSDARARTELFDNLGCVTMRWSRVIGGGLAVLVIGGCGGGGKSSAGTSTSTSTGASARPAIVPVSYDGTTCAPGWSALKPGRYRFALENRGSDAIAMTLLNASD